MSKQSNLDRLAQLHDDDLDAVVAVVESALMLGNGWLKRDAVDGSLMACDATNVVITERTD